MAPMYVVYFCDDAGAQAYFCGKDSNMLIRLHGEEGCAPSNPSPSESLLMIPPTYEEMEN